MAYHEGSTASEFPNGITYDQNNTGSASDITTAIQYTPQMFGGPASAQIITGLTRQKVTTHGGAAVQNYTNEPDGISFDVWTQAADSGILGHHSGSITVITEFSWYSRLSQFSGLQSAVSVSSCCSARRCADECLEGFVECLAGLGRGVARAGDISPLGL